MAKNINRGKEILLSFLEEVEKDKLAKEGPNKTKQLVDYMTSKKTGHDDSEEIPTKVAMKQAELKKGTPNNPRVDEEDEEGQMDEENIHPKGCVDCPYLTETQINMNPAERGFRGKDNAPPSYVTKKACGHPLIKKIGGVPSLPLGENPKFTKRYKNYVDIFCPIRTDQKVITHSHPSYGWEGQKDNPYSIAWKIIKYLKSKGKYPKILRENQNEEGQMDEAAFSRQHYQAVADILKEVKERVPDSEYTDLTRRFITNRLVDLFKKDNPRFDEAKFREAAGLSKE